MYVFSAQMISFHCSCPNVLFLMPKWTFLLHKYFYLCPNIFIVPKASFSMPKCFPLVLKSLLILPKCQHFWSINSLFESKFSLCFPKCKFSSSILVLPNAQNHIFHCPNVHFSLRITLLMKSVICIEMLSYCLLNGDFVAWKTKWTSPAFDQMFTVARNVSNQYNVEKLRLGFSDWQRPIRLIHELLLGKSKPISLNGKYMWIYWLYWWHCISQEYRVGIECP